MILEAFGNARTTLNANASRFGLYTTLYFSQGKGKTMKFKRKRVLGIVATVLLIVVVDTNMEKVDLGF